MAVVTIEMDLFWALQGSMKAIWSFSRIIPVTNIPAIFSSTVVLLFLAIHTLMVFTGMAFLATISLGHLTLIGDEGRSVSAGEPVRNPDIILKRSENIDDHQPVTRAA